MAEKPLVVIGTTNRGKAREIGAALEAAGIRWASLAEFPHAPQVNEDGSTFAENARKKASQLAAALGQWVLAEDSGLEVDSLGGKPGIHSAYYAGPGASDEANYRLLLAQLGDLPLEKRSARFVCHMVLADPSGEIRAEVCEVCRGRITTEPRGESGFGYDPVFEIPEYHRTFAELGPVVKNVISHRGRAVRRILPQLLELVGQGSSSVDE
ncbi:MAG: RdgB/HAM1 family non-canonical purine NTP pyrophosphatase [Thermoguttaceae bacterium]|nr:RdgB/HAM1 family non-canonical purine NTP pyrophosphatase [Thermoguttaceae bacterium]MDW8079224.1 RdgB/HAM1 family non-canonical purine NTP pyrophosphatase [Thermoguttaceae bacterium]